ncbi:MAG TPA: folylpolyglutamate synthase/dihydrofolate synthase family protein [Alphaproteobacteria bacterium]|nr:folylpolyglutamate synthase/dihydrofolate synthase family protein [Alphaproteobacteria bacterium]
MLDQNVLTPAGILQADWNYSPHPVVEETLQRIRKAYPPHLPKGLDRFKRLLAKLGNPHLSLPPVFHVAGTNGKGSTIAFLQAAFEAAGLSVHRFTSPHLVRFSERIVVNGKQIADDMLLAMVAEIEAVADTAEISFFEFFTALSFLAYSRHPADAVLLETGLGGLYDATNVITDPAVAILTRISFDHMRILGETLPEIAMQKAGIIKAGAPVIIAPQSDETVNTVFLKTAAETGAGAVMQAGKDFFVLPVDGGFAYRSAALHMSLPLPALAGQHQFLNAATAIAALEVAGFHAVITPENLTRAMQIVSWPGRLQQLTRGVLRDLLPAGWELWLDGAHNDSGADVLAAHVRQWQDDKPAHLITAYKDKKDTKGLYARLTGLFASTTVADFAIDAPMVPAGEVVALLQELSFADVSAADSLIAAIRSAVAKSDQPARIVIAGSLYLVGHALKLNGD